MAIGPACPIFRDFQGRKRESFIRKASSPRFSYGLCDGHKRVGILVDSNSNLL